MKGEYHIAQSGRNAGKLVPCPAERACTLKGGPHYTLSFLQGVELYIQNHFQDQTKVKDLDPVVIQYIVNNESEEVLSSYEKLAAKMNGEGPKYEPIPNLSDSKAREILYVEYATEFDSILTDKDIHASSAEEAQSPEFHATLLKASELAGRRIVKKYNFNPEEFSLFLQQEGYEGEQLYYKHIWDTQLPAEKAVEFDQVQNNWVANSKGQAGAVCPNCGRDDDGTVMVRINTNTAPELVSSRSPILSCFDCFNEIVVGEL
jgi:hypothetical protein